MCTFKLPLTSFPSRPKPEFASFGLVSLPVALPAVLPAVDSAFPTVSLGFPSDEAGPPRPPGALPVAVSFLA